MWPLRACVLRTPAVSPRDAGRLPADPRSHHPRSPLWWSGPGVSMTPHSAVGTRRRRRRAPVGARRRRRRAPNVTSAGGPSYVISVARDRDGLGWLSLSVDMTTLGVPGVLVPAATHPCSILEYLDTRAKTPARPPCYRSFPPTTPLVLSEERGPGAGAGGSEGVGQRPAAVEGSRPEPCVSVTSRARVRERRPVTSCGRYVPASFGRRQFRLATQAACLPTLALTTHVLHSGGVGLASA